MSGVLEYFMLLTDQKTLLIALIEYIFIVLKNELSNYSIKY